jgi:opacity protein-like surface antigen
MLSLILLGFATHFDGAYVGADIGISAQKSKLKSDSTHSVSKTTPSLGFLFGFGKTFNQFYLGGELDAHFNFGKGQKKLPTNKAEKTPKWETKQSVSFMPSLRVGYLITPKLLGYLRLGAEISKLKVKSFEDKDVNLSKGITFVKPAIGLGVEYKISDHFSVRPEVLYTFSSTKKFKEVELTGPQKGGKAKLDVKSSGWALRLAAIYKF